MHTKSGFCLMNTRMPYIVQVSTCLQCICIYSMSAGRARECVLFMPCRDVCNSVLCCAQHRVLFVFFVYPSELEDSDNATVQLSARHDWMIEWQTRTTDVGDRSGIRRRCVNEPWDCGWGRVFTKAIFQDKENSIPKILVLDHALLHFPHKFPDLFRVRLGKVFVYTKHKGICNIHFFPVYSCAVHVPSQQIIRWMRSRIGKKNRLAPRLKAPSPGWMSAFLTRSERFREWGSVIYPPPREQGWSRFSAAHSHHRHRSQLLDGGDTFTGRAILTQHRCASKQLVDVFVTGIGFEHVDWRWRRQHSSLCTRLATAREYSASEGAPVCRYASVE